MFGETLSHLQQLETLAQNSQKRLWLNIYFFIIIPVFIPLHMQGPTGILWPLGDTWDTLMLDPATVELGHNTAC